VDCPACNSKRSFQLKKNTNLGYKQYRCLDCRKQYNERTGTVFNFLNYPTEVVLLTVFFYYRYKLSLVDVTEMMALRGFLISHETVRLWSQLIGTDIGIKFRVRRKGCCGKDWHMDITYLYVEGRWCYFYRAIDRDSNLIDVYLSDTRDEAAARKFFSTCAETTDVTPKQITTDHEKAFPLAITNALGDKVKHRTNKYKNNIMEQSHRGIKSRASPMKGLKDTWCAMIFCTVFEEIRDFFRLPNCTLAKHRGNFLSKFQEFISISKIAA